MDRPTYAQTPLVRFVCSFVVQQIVGPAANPKQFHSESNLYRLQLTLIKPTPSWVAPLRARQQQHHAARWFTVALPAAALAKLIHCMTQESYSPSELQDY